MTREFLGLTMRNFQVLFLHELEYIRRFSNLHKCTFNTELSNNFVDNFYGSYSLKILIKKPACLKNPDNPTCIELILNNRLTVLKSYFKKLKPKELTYRDFKNFSKQQFEKELVKELNENNVAANQFELFQTMSLGLLNKSAPLK